MSGLAKNAKVEKVEERRNVPTAPAVRLTPQLALSVILSCDTTSAALVVGANYAFILMTTGRIKKCAGCAIGVSMGGGTRPRHAGSYDDTARAGRR